LAAADVRNALQILSFGTPSIRGLTVTYTADEIQAIVRRLVQVGESLEAGL